MSYPPDFGGYYNRPLFHLMMNSDYPALGRLVDGPAIGVLEPYTLAGAEVSASPFAVRQVVSDLAGECLPLHVFDLGQPHVGVVQIVRHPFGRRTAGRFDRLLRLRGIDAGAGFGFGAGQLVAAWLIGAGSWGRVFELLVEHRLEL